MAWNFSHARKFFPIEVSKNFQRRSCWQDSEINISVYSDRLPTLTTFTHARTRKTRFPEPSVPRKNTVITGISKLKGWPIHEVRYLGYKSMKFEKSNGCWKVWFRLQNLNLSHSNNVFYMFHVPFASRVVSSHFLWDRKLEKIMCVFVNPEGYTWKLHLSASIFFWCNWLFGLGDIGRQHLKWVLFVSSEVTPPKKNRTESTKEWIWSFKDKLSNDFNPVGGKILIKDSQGKSANEIKKFTTLFVVRHNLEF